MYSLDRKEISGTGEYAGLPVLWYKLSVPQLEGDVPVARYVNHYYEQFLRRVSNYAAGELTRLAGAQFEDCMNRSRIFEPFSLESSYICQQDESAGTLSVHCRLLTSFGRRGVFSQSFSDLWDMTDGLPKREKAAASK